MKTHVAVLSFCLSALSFSGCQTAGVDPTEDLRLARTAVSIGGIRGSEETRSATLYSVSKGMQYHVLEGETLEIEGEGFTILSVTPKGVSVKSVKTGRRYELSIITDSEAPQ